MNTAYYNLPTKTSAPEGDVMESVIAKGDLAKLTPDQRVEHYTAVCKSLGLNPLTQPFLYITLNGKLVLYATRTCTDQLRKINGISLEVVSRHITDDILTVQVKATTPDGRSDEDFGSVAFPSALKGEARANAVMKAVTKAKRRATLSICGLGWPDETEVADIPGATPHDPQTGEITESAGAGPTTPSDAADAAPVSAPHDAGAALSIEALARDAAMHGETVFSAFYKQRTGQEQARIIAIGHELRAILDAVHDPAADDPGPPDFIHFRSDIDPEHRACIEAYTAGKQAKSDGHQRRAIPPEYREPNATRLALCWQAGFDGTSMPEFNTGD
jgi:hypothetical protein